MRWTKTGRSVKANGESTVYYESNTGINIESRKRAIPHAGGRSGSWMHTTYFLIDGDFEKEFYSLKEAKVAAERRLRLKLLRGDSE